VVEVQVADGSGAEQFKLDQLRSRLTSLVRSNMGDLGKPELLALVTEMIAVGIARRNAKDEVIVPIDGDGGATMTFDAELFGPPDGPWEASPRPEHYGYYWIEYRGYKEPFVIEIDTKRTTRTSDGLVITRRQIIRWKRCRGR
jgi:hypothetical protein